MGVRIKIRWGSDKNPMGFGKLSDGVRKIIRWGSDKNPMLNAPSIDFNHEVSEELFRNWLELNFRDFRLVFDVRLFDIVLNIVLNVY